VSVAEAVAALRNLLDYVKRRDLPTTGDLDLDSPAGVQRALEALVGSGVVTCFAEGAEPVYAIGHGQHLAAAYYRNTIVHFFVTGAIAELALLRAAEDDVSERRAEFWDEAMRLRDLLKFEFFFAGKERFREELHEELALQDADWEPQLIEGPRAIQAFVQGLRPFHAHRVLLPYLEAYQVVADALARHDPGAALDQGPFLGRCLALGRQYHLQRRIRSAESVSKVLFENALRLANNRQLAGGEVPDLVQRRRAFASEIQQAIRRAEAINVLAASRRAGLIT
jgi:glycerol-3-phosphate O-acyltransferase